LNLESLKFSEDHEWIQLDGDIATIGITDYAQKELGDVVYVELPETGSSVSKGDACSNIESVKAVSDIYSPVSGEIVEANGQLEDKPESVNQDPYGSGWIFKIKVGASSELDGLMDHKQYEAYIKGLAEE
jgi:glycine cleavage system H protein